MRCALFLLTFSVLLLCSSWASAQSSLPSAFSTFSIADYVEDVVTVVVAGLGVVIAASFGFMAVKHLWAWGRSAFGDTPSSGSTYDAPAAPAGYTVGQMFYVESLDDEDESDVYERFMDDPEARGKSFGEWKLFDARRRGII